MSDFRRLAGLETFEEWLDDSGSEALLEAEGTDTMISPGQKARPKPKNRVRKDPSKKGAEAATPSANAGKDFTKLPKPRNKAEPRLGPVQQRRPSPKKTKTGAKGGSPQPHTPKRLKAAPQPKGALPPASVSPQPSTDAAAKLAALEKERADRLAALNAAPTANSNGTHSPSGTVSQASAPRPSSARSNLSQRIQALSVHRDPFPSKKLAGSTSGNTSVRSGTQSVGNYSGATSAPQGSGGGGSVPPGPPSSGNPPSSGSKVPSSSKAPPVQGSPDAEAPKGKRRWPHSFPDTQQNRQHPDFKRAVHMHDIGVGLAQHVLPALSSDKHAAAFERLANPYRRAYGHYATKLGSTDPEELQAGMEHSKRRNFFSKGIGGALSHLAAQYRANYLRGSLSKPKAPKPPTAPVLNAPRLDAFASNTADHHNAIADHEQALAKHKEALAQHASEMDAYRQKLGAYNSASSYLRDLARSHQTAAIGKVIKNPNFMKKRLEKHPQVFHVGADHEESVDSRRPSRFATKLFRQPLPTGVLFQ